MLPISNHVALFSVSVRINSWDLRLAGGFQSLMDTGFTFRRLSHPLPFPAYNPMGFLGKESQG